MEQSYPKDTLLQGTTFYLKYYSGKDICLVCIQKYVDNER